MQEACVEILGVTPEAVTPEALLRDDLGADSLDFAELVMALEDKLGITIPEGQMKGLQTVADAVDLIESNLSPAAS